MDIELAISNDDRPGFTHINIWVYIIFSEETVVVKIYDYFPGIRVDMAVL